MTNPTPAPERGERPTCLRCGRDPASVKFSANGLCCMSCGGDIEYKPTPTDSAERERLEAILFDHIESAIMKARASVGGTVVIARREAEHLARRLRAAALLRPTDSAERDGLAIEVMRILTDYRRSVVQEYAGDKRGSEAGIRGQRAAGDAILALLRSTDSAVGAGERERLEAIAADHIETAIMRSRGSATGSRAIAVREADHLIRRLYPPASTLPAPVETGSAWEDHPVRLREPGETEGDHG